MNNIGLFLTSAIIWGSTWLAITFQLGVVAPMVSVVYRFGLASLILLGYCQITKKRFEFSPSDHGLILLQGLLLFGINYWLVYSGIAKITSALAAIISTSIIYFNIVFGRLFLGDEIRTNVLIGATVGLVGISLILLPEFSTKENTNTLEGVLLALTACIFASLGNIVSAATRRRNIPVIQLNALGMGYAAILLSALSVIGGYSFEFEFTASYIGSLLYLSIFGSIIAFGAFITLVGRIGADKAAYITFVFPVIAIILSTIFEDYHWTIYSFIGLAIIMIGNVIAMEKHTVILNKLKKDEF